jgi:hypothetical protein
MVPYFVSRSAAAVMLLLCRMAVFLTTPWAFGQSLTGDAWQTPISTFGVQSITDVTVKGTEYWAVADSGIFKSTNLTSWSKVTTTGLTDALITIRWTGTRFVGTGLGLWTSNDGVAWTFRDSAYPFAPLGLALKGNTVVAAGVGGTILRSVDGGLTWTRQNLGLQYSFFGATATATHFVVVGADGAIFNSADGETWVPRDSGTQATLYDVAVASNRLVAVGADATVLTSSDNGGTWTGYALTGGQGINLTAVTGDASMTVIGGPPRLVLRTTTPSNAAAMQFISVPQNSAPLTAALRGTNGWVLAGQGGTVMTSTDSNTWTLRYPVVSVQFTAAVRTTSQFIAGGYPSDKFVTSGDGVTWTTVTTTIPAADNHAVTSLVWSPSPAKLVAGTSGGRIYSTTAANGTGLTLRISGTTQRLNPGIWTGTMFIVPGNGGTILTSTNGDSWTGRNSGTTMDLSSAASNGTRHVVCGGGNGAGTIQTSTNGISWSQAAAPDGFMFGVAWNGSLFVAVGWGGLILTSPDGLEWTERPVEFEGSPHEESFTAVAWAGTNWVALDTSGSAALSTDGINWVVRRYATATVISGLVYGNSRLVAAGDASQLLTSAAAAARMPVVRIPPFSITVDESSRSLLGFLAEGTPPMTYQWRKNGQEIPGGTDAILTFDPAGAEDTGSYDVVISNPAGSVTSTAANLRVRARPEITSFADADQYAAAGGSASFSVSAAGAGPITYQWFKAGTGALTGRTASTLNLASITAAEAGEYYVEVSNEYGTASSGVARLFLTIPLATALDLAPGAAPVETGGTPAGSDWRGGSGYQHDGADAGFSGAIPDGGESWVQMTVSGMSAVSFWWDVSSEPCCDGLRLTVNGEYVDEIRGGSQWRHRTVPLNAGGTSVLRWTYAKDSSAVSGQDRGWLDQVTFTPGPALDLPVWAAELNLPVNRRLPADRNGVLLTENTLAYALGINPLTATAADLPVLTRNGHTLTFQYTRTRRTTGTAYQVQWSTDPAAAVWNTSGISEGVTGSTTAQETVAATLSVPANSVRVFMRLRVSLGGM